MSDDPCQPIAGVAMHPLVSTAWLHSHLGDPDLRVLDAMVDSVLETGDVTGGRPRWEAGHIPGAGVADQLVDLSEPNDRFRLEFPSAARFAGVMGSLGVGDDARVVVYDAHEGSVWAARLWWLLRCYGFDQAAILDGGWHAWTSEGRPVTTELPAHEPAAFTPRLRAEMLVAKSDVRCAFEEGNACVVDVRQPGEYRGERVFYGRPGHLPGAINVPYRALINPATKCFLPTEELRRTLAPAIAADRVITYCGAGIAAAGAAFALHLVGHRSVAVYDRSLVEWAADPSLPLVTGDA